jgi:hypothetical protein
MASKRFEMGETQTELGMRIIGDAPILRLLLSAGSWQIV